MVIVAALIGVVVIVTGAALLRSSGRMGQPENERVWNPIGLVPAALAPETTDFHAAPVQREPRGVRTPVARRSQQVKAPGYLSINSRPWAEVSVDGRVVGNTPQIKIRVTPGRHHLVLAREGFQAHSAWVVVPAGGSVRLTDITLRVVTR